MVGGGSRRDDGPLKISSHNVYAALESLKKKKRSESSKIKGSSKNQVKEPEPQVFWAPAPLTVTSWADVDDDDDYFATTAPPQNVWGSSEPQHEKESTAIAEEESGSEDDGVDECDEDVEEEPEHEPEAPIPTEPVVKNVTPAPLVPKETERQLSKKELKKKGLAELDAVLAELGISGNNARENETNGVASEKNPDDQNADEERKESAPSALSESKTSKKKKAKKEKSSKEVNDPQEPPNAKETDASSGAVEPVEDDSSGIDVKERMKKVAAMKKKKSSKEMDAAAKAAAIEAAARSAKLAAAKKKEKNHYNQQPVR